MNIEGVGIKPPNSIAFQISDFISEKFKALAVERCCANNYRNGNSWQRGMKKNPEAVIEEGLKSEFSVHSWLLHRGVNTEWSPGRKAGGDGNVDLEYKGTTMQVKSGVRWVRRFDSRKRMLPLCDIYIFCTTKTDTVTIDGWVFKEQMVHFGNKRPQGHYNIEVRDNELKPMEALARYLKSL